MMQKLSIKEKLADLKKADDEFVYFMAFLYALSTGEVGSIDLIKTAQDSGYGKFSNTFKEIFRLGVGWGYGLSRSCEMIAIKFSDNTDPLKQLLVKLAQVIRLGDELRIFFTEEMSAALHNYTVRYERNLESQKLFLEMFYTISSTAVFMISGNSIHDHAHGQHRLFIRIYDFIYRRNCKHGFIYRDNVCHISKGQNIFRK
ncbi:hypothetical protein DYY67_2135 [Candidatus Nitrosotalea sp. TS]|uniref:hypothetical protein n=1 Tax=Candidatus Nitrosotalea sp. TS TaxID=2341020 RepID=UPI00140D7B1B|nr:hypothetical protein [Candidatus Nitrosotalea sp. TS]NHI02860.1 hypothetical protein [Candidatus Nitrosotalea sp. TS]